MHRRILISCVALALAGAQAQAQEPMQASRWYGGVAGALTESNLTIGDWDDGSLNSGEIDNRDVGYKALAGYRFNHYLWGEASWTDLGESTFDGTSVGGLVWQSGDVTGRADAQGLTVSGIAALPFGGWGALFARGGIFAWDSQVVYDPTIISSGTGGTIGTLRVNDDGVSFMYGAGGEVSLPWNLRLRLEWERYRPDFARTSDYSVDFYSVGLLLQIQ